MWKEEDFFPQEFYTRVNDRIILVPDEPSDRESQSELATEFYDQWKRDLS